MVVLVRIHILSTPQFLVSPCLSSAIDVVHLIYNLFYGVAST